MEFSVFLFLFFFVEFCCLVLFVGVIGFVLFFYVLRWVSFRFFRGIDSVGVICIFSEGFGVVVCEVGIWV